MNGVKVTSPSYLLRPGDVITVRQKDKIYDIYKGVIANNSPSPPDWVTFDGDTLRATMQRNPGPGDYSLPVNVDIVVEFLRGSASEYRLQRFCWAALLHPRPASVAPQNSLTAREQAIILREGESSFSAPLFTVRIAPMKCSRLLSLVALLFATLAWGGDTNLRTGAYQRTRTFQNLGNQPNTFWGNYLFMPISPTPPMGTNTNSGLCRSERRDML